MMVSLKIKQSKYHYTHMHVKIIENKYINISSVVTEVLVMCPIGNHNNSDQDLQEFDQS
jgi:hypothetical protein